MAICLRAREEFADNRFHSSVFIALAAKFGVVASRYKKDVNILARSYPAK